MDRRLILDQLNAALSAAYHRAADEGYPELRAVIQPMQERIAALAQVQRPAGTRPDDRCACRHAARDHGDSGACYYTLRQFGGGAAWINCACRQFAPVPPAKARPALLGRVGGYDALAPEANEYGGSRHTKGATDG
jgi:hypothetical protein